MNILEEFYAIYLVKKSETENYQMIWNGQRKSLRIYAIIMRRTILAGKSFIIVAAYTAAPALAAA
jgi:hypothetical protein